jgi:hypothetical protein
VDASDQGHGSGQVQDDGRGAGRARQALAARVHAERPHVGRGGSRRHSHRHGGARRRRCRRARAGSAAAGGEGGPSAVRGCGGARLQRLGEARLGHVPRCAAAVGRQLYILSRVGIHRISSWTCPDNPFCVRRCWSVFPSCSGRYSASHGWVTLRSAKLVQRPGKSSALSLERVLSTERVDVCVCAWAVERAQYRLGPARLRGSSAAGRTHETRAAVRPRVVFQHRLLPTAVPGQGALQAHRERQEVRAVPRQAHAAVTAAASLRTLHPAPESSRGALPTSVRAAGRWRVLEPIAVVRRRVHVHAQGTQ